MCQLKNSHSWILTQEVLKAKISQGNNEDKNDYIILFNSPNKEHQRIVLTGQMPLVSLNE